jgi:L-gulonolactone oxidase
MLADGSRVSCSRTEYPDLFLATLCGLGATGIILSVQMEVEPAFRLKDIQESLPFHAVVDGLDYLVASAEHIRLTWFPATDTVRCSFADRTEEVSTVYTCGFQRVLIIAQLYVAAKILHRELVASAY